MGTAAKRMAALMALNALFLGGCTLVPSPVNEPIAVNGNSQFTEKIGRAHV